ncbi:hypothetical protein HDC91_002493 [Mucilaginibacter sp. AK015]|nr:hypothetical protein [Mucilaginibacter sp. AK015]
MLLFFMGFILKTPLFHVCANHGMQLPFSGLFARVNAIYCEITGIGVFFALMPCIITIIIGSFVGSFKIPFLVTVFFNILTVQKAGIILYYT